MNFNWRAAVIAFVVTGVIITYDIKFGATPYLFLAGATIGGLIAGYIVGSYMGGILNGAFPTGLAITVVTALFIIDRGYGLSAGGLSAGLFPVFFIPSLIGPITGVTIKKMKDMGIKYYNKFNNSDNAVIGTTAADSTYTEKRVPKFKKMDSKEVIFIFIVIGIVIIGILEIFFFFMFLILSNGLGG